MNSFSFSVRSEEKCFGNRYHWQVRIFARIDVYLPSRNEVISGKEKTVSVTLGNYN